ncbi:MAG: type II toxin-antitoxin system PemK/MazF family toxin [Balneolales bacterium]
MTLDVNKQGTIRPSRGEIWWMQLDPSKMHQTVISRPCLVISVDQINTAAAEVVIVVPIAFENKKLASHVRVDPKDVDIKSTGFIHCEDIRLVPLSRVQAFAGVLPSYKMDEVEETVSMLLGLG